MAAHGLFVACKMARKIQYSKVGKQACRHVAHVLEILPNSLEKINFGVVFANLLWQALLRDAAISKVLREHTTS